MLKKMMMTCLAFSALLTTNACGVESGAESEEQLSESAAEATIFTNYWRRVNRENCMDLFNAPCSGSVPANQCPEAEIGVACEPPGRQCYKVISSTKVDLMVCGGPQ